jgi:hypothetical protein
MINTMIFRNILAAEKSGIKCIDFISAKELKNELEFLNIL